VPLIVLDHGQETALESLPRDEFERSQIRDRANIIILAQEFESVRQMAGTLTVDPRTIRKWLKRYNQSGIDGLKDVPHGGANNRISDETRNAVINSTNNETPTEGDRWTTRSLANRHGISPSTVQRIWYAEGLRPKKRRRSVIPIRH
jgi:transposase